MCIQRFGAVAATGMGIGRKMLSVVLSFVLFPKPLLLQQAVRRTSFRRAVASPLLSGSLSHHHELVCVKALA